MNNFIMPLTEEQIGVRYDSFKLALQKLFDNGGKNIVETGCIRWVGSMNSQERDAAVMARETGHYVGDLSSGASTLLFALTAKKYNLNFDSIDISKDSILSAKDILGKDKKYATFHQADSIETLKNWDKPIDLLYLDSYGSSVEHEKAQLHQLAEIEAAYDKLSPSCIVLLDDNRVNSKTLLSTEFLMKKGFLALMDDFQALFERIKR